MNASPPLVETEWLAARLSQPGIVVIDASWHMPAARRDARAEFEATHIPGARFFDIEALSDHTTDLPHMMPSPTAFAAGAGALGIGDSDLVVAYDAAGIYTAPRAWWMLRAMGHDRVAVLNGGLPKWLREGRPVERDAPDVCSATFTARPVSDISRDYRAIQATLASRNEQIVDARSPGRFRGAEAEPRAGLRAGHIPGSRNVHYAELVAPDGTMKAPDDLSRIFSDAGVDLDRPLVTSCGSGVTAAIVLLAAEIAGAKNTALYDGSWTEWGSRPGAPIATGAA